MTQDGLIYNKLSKFYDFIIGERLIKAHPLMVKKLSQYFHNQENIKVIEIGCGTGTSFKHYPKNTDLIAIEPSEKMIEQAVHRKNEFAGNNIEVKMGFGDEIPYEDDFFDCLYASSVISVVNDPEGCMKEFIRVVKPGGKLFISGHFQDDSLQSKAWSSVWNGVTTKFLGYTMKRHQDFFKGFKNLKEIEKLKTNHLLGFPLSSFFIVEKTT